MTTLTAKYDQLINDRDVIVDTKRKSDYYEYRGPDEKLNKGRGLVELGNDYLSKLFISEYNIKKIQNALRYKAYQELKIYISEQNKLELKIIMRQVYLEHSKNLSYDIGRQIKELNQKVVSKTYPRMKSNIIQYHEYMKQRNVYNVMDREQYPSSAGTKATDNGNIFAI